MKLPTINYGSPASSAAASSVNPSHSANSKAWFSLSTLVSPLRLFTGAMLAALLSVSSLTAGTTSQSTSAPADNILIGSNPAPYASGSLQFKKTDNEDQSGGVAFALSSASSINAVSFYVHGVGAGAPNALATISIVSFGSLTEAGIKGPSTSLFSETFTMPSDVAANNYLTFSFSAPASLQAGTYGIVFQWVNAATAESINFRAAATASSALQFRNTVDKSGNITNQEVGLPSARELLFLVQGSTVSAVPEPSTYAAIFGVVTLLGTVAIRRRNSTRRRSVQSAVPSVAQSETLSSSSSQV